MDDIFVRSSGWVCWELSYMKRLASKSGNRWKRFFGVKSLDRALGKEKWT